MITREEALDLFRSDDLIGIGMEADAVRRKWHPEGIVSYIIDRNINYTNFCTEYCSFCAFYRPMGHAEGYVLPNESIYREDPGDPRPGRHRRADAGRPAPRPQDRVVRGPVPRHQAALPHPPALPLGAGSHQHRRSQRPEPARHHRAPDGCRPRFHPRRRRGDPGRRRAPPHQPAEVLGRRIGWTCTAPRTSWACAPPPP